MDETKCIRLTGDGATRSLWCDECEGYSGWKRPGCPGLAVPDDRPLSKDLPVGTRVRNDADGTVRTLMARTPGASFGEAWVTGNGWILDMAIDNGPWSILPSDEPRPSAIAVHPVLGRVYEHDKWGTTHPALPSDEEAEPPFDIEPVDSTVLDDAVCWDEPTPDLDALTRAATPGPWTLVEDCGTTLGTQPYPHGIRMEPPKGNCAVRPENHEHDEWCFVRMELCEFETADAALIVAMRNTLPSLLAHVSRLEAVVEAARAAKTWIESPKTTTGGWVYRPGWDIVSRLRDTLATLDASVVVPDADG